MTGINIGGVVYSKSAGRVSASLILPVLRISKRGIGITTDTVFEVSSLLGGQLIVVDVLILGFGLCLEIREEDNHA